MPIEPIITPIQQAATANTVVVVSAFTLSMTVFILGSLFLLITCVYLLMWAFGKPMMIAKETAFGGFIIQHFDTPKSAIMKKANIAGDGFRYSNIRDGTVATKSKSVLNLSGRNIALTFAQLGVTIPINILGAMSTLIHQGTNNIRELNNRYGQKSVLTDQGLIPLNQDGTFSFDSVEQPKIFTDQKNQPIIKTMLRNNGEDVVISGYNFADFNELIIQAQEEKLIPLIIESVPNFMNKNISADYTEKKIRIAQLLNMPKFAKSYAWEIMSFIAGIAIILVIGLAVK